MVLAITSGSSMVSSPPTVKWWNARTDVVSTTSKRVKFPQAVQRYRVVTASTVVDSSESPISAAALSAAARSHVEVVGPGRVEVEHRVEIETIAGERHPLLVNDSTERTRMVHET